MDKGISNVSDNSNHTSTSDKDSSVNRDQNSNNSGQIPMSNEAVNAHSKAKALLNCLSQVNKIPQKFVTQITNNMTPVQYVSQDTNNSSGFLDSVLGQSNFSKDDSYHFSGDELSSLIHQVKSCCENKTLESEHKQQQVKQSVQEPTLGAFGEIKQKSSLLSLNRHRSFNDRCFEDESSLQTRTLKSGVNRSYNDLVVKELIWPNDLVLRGSECVNLLDMSHSELFQAIIKTILGTLPDMVENRHAKNLIKKYFAAMFRDATDNTLLTTLKAHKLVMGQLEKGELDLEANWREWDEVRRNSVLTQTLHSLSTLNNNKRNLSKSHANQGSGGNTSTSHSKENSIRSSEQGRSQALYLL